MAIQISVVVFILSSKKKKLGCPSTVDETFFCNNEKHEGIDTDCVFSVFVRDFAFFSLWFLHFPADQLNVIASRLTALDSAVPIIAAESASGC